MNELSHLYSTHEGKICDRWFSYLEKYDRTLSDFRDSPVRLFEIGSQNGGGLELWARYFSNGEFFVGCDINPKCEQLTFTDPRISILVNDVKDDRILEQLDLISTYWNVIIDDGSHISRDIIISFARFFPRLADEGIFIVEDLHCSYWKEFEGGLADPFSSIAFFKRLADLVNFDHWGIQLDRTEYLDSFANYHGCQFDEATLAQIYSVEFVNSMCLIRKRAIEGNKLGPRVIVGAEECVTNDVLKYNGALSKPLDQKQNIWSDRGLFDVPDIDGDSTEFAIIQKQTIQACDVIASQARRIHTLNTLVNQLKAELTAREETLSQIAIENRLEKLAVEEKQAENHARVATLIKTIKVRDEQILVLMATQSSLSARLARLIERVAKKIFPAYSARRLLLKRIINIADRVYHHGLKGSLLVHRTDSLPNNDISIQDTTKVKHIAKPDEFEAWIQANEPTEATLEQQRESSPVYDQGNPLFSIILPVYMISSDILLATLSSVQNQTWQNWELCIAYADLENETNWALLEQAASVDPRLKIKRLSENGGISVNSNAALALASGEFIALLDHDDELSPWALHDMAQCIERMPETDFLYSDKDSINTNGFLRLNPLFKPTWSPEMLYSVNYLTHFNVMRRSLVESVGGWNSNCDGAQDWDIFLRVSEKSRRIERVIGVHYHWRIIAGSTSTGLGAKPYAALGQLRTLENRVHRIGLPATVQPDSDSGFRLLWYLEHLPTIDIILHGAAAEQHIKHLLKIIGDQTEGLLATVILVWTSDNPPPSLSYKLSNEIPLRIIQVKSFGTKTAAISEAVNTCDAPVVMMIDVEVTNLAPRSIHDLAGWVLKHPEIGFAAALVLLNDDTVIEAGQVVGECNNAQPLFYGMPLRHWGPLGGPLWYRNISAASATTIAFRRDRLDVQKYITTPWPKAMVSICADARGNDHRGVVSPHARAYLAHLPALSGQWHDSMRSDPYFHPAFCSVSPLTLDTKND